LPLEVTITVWETGGHKAKKSGRETNSKLSRAERNSTLGQIIRRQLDSHLVTRQDTDVVFTHAPGNVSGDHVAILQLDTEHGIGQGINNSTLHFDVIFFCHKSSMF